MDLYKQNAVLATVCFLFVFVTTHFFLLSQVRDQTMRTSLTILLVICEGLESRLASEG